MVVGAQKFRGVSNSPSEVDIDSTSRDEQFMEPSTSGVVASDLNGEQLSHFIALANTFLDTLPATRADPLKTNLEAELNSAIISWEGATNARPFGFGIRTPTMHIIFSNEDDPEHVHAIFRILPHEYGANLQN